MAEPKFKIGDIVESTVNRTNSYEIIGVSINYYWMMYKDGVGRPFSSLISEIDRSYKLCVDLPEEGDIIRNKSGSPKKYEYLGKFKDWHMIVRSDNPAYTPFAILEDVLFRAYEW